MFKRIQRRQTTIFKMQTPTSISFMHEQDVGKGWHHIWTRALPEVFPASSLPTEGASYFSALKAACLFNHKNVAEKTLLSVLLHVYASLLWIWGAIEDQQLDRLTLKQWTRSVHVIKKKKKIHWRFKMFTCMVADREDMKRREEASISIPLFQGMG